MKTGIFGYKGRVHYHCAAPINTWIDELGDLPKTEFLQHSVSVLTVNCMLIIVCSPAITSHSMSWKEQKNMHNIIPRRIKNDSKTISKDNWRR